MDCYLPERADEDWARLRHLGQRRYRLVGEAVACGQQIVDLLACCWPAALACAARPLETTTWLGCLAVTLDRCNGEPARVHRMGQEAFVAAVRRELPRFGASRVSRKVADRFYAALSDRCGALAQRRGALERAHLLMGDWRSALARQAEVQARMVALLDAMGLTELATSIPGLSPVGAAVILAETGDPSRFASGRGVVKHAGLNPVENTSGAFRGRTRVSRRGRPALRTAAWRAVWGAEKTNPVLAAKLTHLTTREQDRLTVGQARVACAAALLRWLYAIITRRQAWNEDIAAGRVGTRHPLAVAA